MVLDYSQPFVVVDVEERSVIDVSIPRIMLTRHVPDLRSLHGLVLDADVSALLAAHLTTLAPRLQQMHASRGAALGDIIVQLFLLALSHIATDQVATVADRRSALFARAAEMVDAHLAFEGLPPEWLSDMLRVSRSELYQAFERQGGVARFIWRRRLEAARTALTDPQDPRRIGAIALACGFSSEAHFARAYRQAFGKTASASRRDGR